MRRLDSRRVASRPRGSRARSATIGPRDSTKSADGTGPVSSSASSKRRMAAFRWKCGATKNRCASLLLDPEREHSPRGELLARPQHGCRKRRLVRRVGEGLGLQAKAEALSIRAPLLAGDAAVQEVGGVELYAGLGGRDVERPAR